MKKLYYLLAGISLVLVTVIACEKSSVEIEELQTIKEELSAKGDKVIVCHYDKELDEFKHINISTSALEKHLANHDEGEAMKDYIPDFTTVEGDGFAGDLDNDGIADCADCDNTDASEEASMKNIWYLDADDDGYGDPDMYIETCMTLADANIHFAAMEDEQDQKVFVDDNTDCDDGDAAVYPGAGC